ncbi:MAG: T9SS type A sorting domain-containing protein [Flavobacteriales bacterium]|nr:T9SS type A sorting domain-containing protein [Flavobacteriales bacterium]
MKHITLFAVAALFGGAMNAQVFTSGVEAWTDSLPDDFVGSKTNIALSDIGQVDANPHSGTYAVRLENTTTSHKRFTTQTVTVVEGETYDITFWVRGEGDIRVGLYDGRPGTSSGYSPYNPQNYVAISGNTWQELTLSVVAGNDTTGAEFIFSVRSTVAPEHLVIDDVNIETGAAQGDTPIYDIQFTTAPDGASPMENQSVSTSGIVTAIFPAGGANPGYFLQDGPGPWNGVFVYDNTNIPSLGDEISLTATVTEYFTLTELTGVVGYTVESTGNPLPAASFTSTFGAGSEQYEGVLVTANNANCTDPSAANGQWIIDNGTGPLFVSPLIYDYPNPAQGTLYDVTGPIFYAFSEWKVLPRDINDVVFATSIGEFAGSTVTVFPNPADNALTMDLGSVNGRTEYTVSDATGRIVLTDMVNTQRSTVDVSVLSNGIYVVTLRNADAIWSTRVQVQH